MTSKSEKQEIILQLIGQGWSRQEIFHYVNTKAAPPWGITWRQLDRLINSARKTITAKADYETTWEHGLSIHRLHELYKKSCAIQDYKTCLAVQKEINRMLGIGPTPASPDSDDVPAQKHIENNTVKLLAVIENHFGPLADGHSLDYVELIELAAAKLKT